VEILTSYTRETPRTIREMKCFRPEVCRCGRLFDVPNVWKIKKESASLFVPWVDLYNVLPVHDIIECLFGLGDEGGGSMFANILNSLVEKQLTEIIWSPTVLNGSSSDLIDGINIEWKFVCSRSCNFSSSNTKKTEVRRKPIWWKDDGYRFDSFDCYLNIVGRCLRFDC